MRLYVVDAGIGGPEGETSTIFEPFRRAVSGEPTPSSGLGLGLFIVQRIAQAHGGSVEVRSTEDAGTTFTLRLPRRARQVPESGGARH